MKQFLTTEETVQILKLESPHELIPHIQAGLKPYDKYGRPLHENKWAMGPGTRYSDAEIDEMVKERRRVIKQEHKIDPNQLDRYYPPMQHQHEYEDWLAANDEVRKQAFFPHRVEYSWKHLKLPDSIEEADKLIAEMMDWRFLAADVVKRAERDRPVLLLELDEVLGKPGMKPHALFQRLRSGALIPLSNTGKAIPCPTLHHEYGHVHARKVELGHEKWIRELAKSVELDPGLTHESGSWRYLHLPETEEAQKDLLKMLRDKNALFDKAEVDRIVNETGWAERKSGTPPLDEPIEPAREKAGQNRAIVCDESPGNTIKRLGNGYIVTFQGTSIVMPGNVVGGGYIYHFLKMYSQSTDKELPSSAELENLVIGTIPIEPTSYNMGAALDEGLNVAEQFSESDLDKKGKKELREHMALLNADLAEAKQACDTGRIEQIQLAIDQLKEWALKEYAYYLEKGAMLKRDTGSILNSDHEKKAEGRVRRNVNRLLDNLASNKKAEAFVKHMKSSIKYGKQPRYSPSKPINWTVE